MTIRVKTTIVVIIIVVILLYALICEYKDYVLLGSRPALSSITNDVDKNNELLFYGCFNSENNIQWRSSYILSVVSMLVISYILKEWGYIVELNLQLLILFTIFMVFFGASTFKNFHLYRPMCAKIKPENIIL
jgi:hypothetical protein